jgi:hypothetical protein
LERSNLLIANLLESFMQTKFLSMKELKPRRLLCRLGSYTRFFLIMCNEVNTTNVEQTALKLSILASIRSNADKRLTDSNISITTIIRDEHTERQKGALAMLMAVTTGFALMMPRRRVGRCSIQGRLC